MLVCGIGALAVGCDAKDGDGDGEHVSPQGTASAATSPDEEDTAAEDTEAGDTEAGDTEAGDTEAGDTEAGDTEADDTDPEPAETSTTDEPEPAETSTTDEPEVCQTGAVRACAVDEFSDECGEQACEDGQWGECLETPLCDGGSETSTPLVLSFDGAEPQLVASATSVFDNDLTGECVSTDWPTATTPWLALDRDGDGGIADGRELFGSGTRLGGGMRAEHGFAALAELDDDRDGRITPSDRRFAELVVWADEDGDKRGTGGELRSLQDLRVLSIELGYASEKVCDARGNCGIERATMTFVGDGGAVATGRVIDLHLACR
jgi:hypothetical protein